VKALTLLQPWASLIALGAKRLETRSWRTNYRGEIAIHAGKGWPLSPHLREDPALAAIAEQFGITYADHPRGAIIAIATLRDVVSITREFPIEAHERACGDFTPGRYAWSLTNVRPLPEIVRCNGAQGLWTVPDVVEAQLRELLREPPAPSLFDEERCA
jgi:hypothetical protein